MTERELFEEVRKLLKLTGWQYYHTFRSDHSTAGFPDLTLLKGRSLVFVELKTETGTVTQAQVDWLDALWLATPKVYLWRPRHIELIASYLKGEVIPLTSLNEWYNWR